MSCCWGNNSNFGCCDSTVTLSGVVSNAAGPASGIAIQYTVNCRTRTVTTGADGRFTIVVPRGACVQVSVGALVGVTVTPASYSFTACSDRTDLNFTLAPVATTFTVSGTVSGLPNVSGIAVNYSINGMLASATTDAGGNFSFNAPSGANVVILPSSQAGFSAAPTNYAIMGISANTMNQNFTYTANTISVSGAVSGLPNVSGIVVNYTVGGVAASTATNASGNYVINAPFGSNVVVTPSSQVGFTVLPTNYTFPILMGDMANQNFAYTAV